MKKEKIKNILLIIIVALVTSFVTAYGVSSTFDSSNVCYQVDSNTGASVQDTIDDLYGRASDYSELKSYFQNNPTSYFDGDILRIGKNSTSTTNWKELLFYHNDIIRSRLYYTPSTDKTILSAGNSSGTAGQGTLELQGNPVTINGTSIGDYFIVTRTAFTTTTKTAIASHGSGSFANVLTNLPSVTVPSGYTLVSHTYIELAGAVGVSCIFDSINNAYKISNINGYIFNAGSNSLPTGSYLNINIISLWKKS